MYNDNIEPASIDQLKRGRDGRMILVEADVGNIVQQIKEINDCFNVRHSDAGGYFVVFYRNPLTQQEELVTTAQELDGRLLNRIRKVAHRSYDFAAELKRLDEEIEREREYQFEQKVHERGEEIAHALRKDVGAWKDQARSKKSWGKGLAGHK
jgi:hypothetical protein